MTGEKPGFGAFKNWSGRKKEEEKQADEPLPREDLVSGKESGSAGRKEPPGQSFSLLRRERGKVPRFRKTLALVLMMAACFVFLAVFNLAMGLRGREQETAAAGRNSLNRRDEFSLGDYRSRIPAGGEVLVMAPENPPGYRPIPEYGDYPPPSPPVPPPVPPASPRGGGGSRLSESDLQAIRSPISKGSYGTQAPGSYRTPAPGMAAGPGYYAQPAGQVYPVSGDPGPYGGTMTQPLSREQYMNQRIDEYTRLAQAVNATGGTGGGEGSPPRDPNNGRYTQAGNYNNVNEDAGSFQFLTDTQLYPGAIIHAVLVSRIDTDYPGPIFARTIENVYDSKTGRNLLIPQGTVLMGDYSSSSIGVSKVQVAWKEMIVNYENTAYRLGLGGMAGVDRRGQAGIAGTLDDHYFEWLKAAGIVSAFTMLNSEVSYQSKGQANQNLRDLIDLNQGLVNKLGARIMDRALDIQPTVRVPNGTECSVAVNTVLNLRPFAEIKAEQRYVRH